VHHCWGGGVLESRVGSNSALFICKPALRCVLLYTCSLLLLPPLLPPLLLLLLV
jgi:hypothetical protein